MNRLLDLWRGLVRNIVQDVPDALAVAEFGQPNLSPADLTAIADAVAERAEPTPIFHAVRAACVRSAAFERTAYCGDADLEEWGIELLHTDDDDIAADYDGLLYAAAWMAMHAMPEPTDLGDL